MRCSKCKGEEKTKNGFKNGIQRYKCKTFGCNYTKSTPHGYTVEVKREALRYYLARFVRKTYSVSKSLDMIFYSLYLFCFRHFVSSIFF